MSTHNVMKCPTTRYVVIDLQSCKFTFALLYTYLISVYISHVIISVTIFELKKYIKYAAFNKSRIKNRNSHFGFMTSY
jgi:hypothetical protein